MSLEIRDLGHRFADGAWLFRHLYVTLDPGKVYALTGPSGSGKSTLLHLLAGWLAPVEGIIERPRSGRLAWVPQLPHGAVHRTALDHVILPLLGCGYDLGEARRRAEALLGRFSLAERANHRFSTLSGGEAQRLMIARALAANPTILLIDEPTAQLDRRTAATVDAAIAASSESGVVTVVATHDAQTRDACSDVLALDGWGH